MNENWKYAFVINSDGLVSIHGSGKTFIIVEQLELGGEIIENPKDYVLKEGEGLVYEDCATALSMVKPRWNGKEWKETATAEEVEAAKPEVQMPGEITLTNKQLEEQNLLIMGVAAELYEKNLQLEEQNLQTMMALTELYETITGGI